MDLPARCRDHRGGRTGNARPWVDSPGHGEVHAGHAAQHRKRARQGRGRSGQLRLHHLHLAHRSHCAGWVRGSRGHAQAERITARRAALEEGQLRHRGPGRGRPQRDGDRAAGSGSADGCIKPACSPHHAAATQAIDGLRSRRSADEARRSHRVPFLRSLDRGRTGNRLGARRHLRHRFLRHRLQPLQGIRHADRAGHARLRGQGRSLHRDDRRAAGCGPRVVRQGWRRRPLPVRRHG